MAHRVCPWWLGYVLASPLRRLMMDPRKLLAPYVKEGMTVLEPGPGMGFFTLELARLVGPSGRVIAVDIQPKMLSRLKQRASRAGVLERIDARLAAPDSLGLSDLAGTVDFTLAFAVVHEMPDAAQFFAQVAAASKPGSHLFFAEPGGHVSAKEFEAELEAAAKGGFVSVDRPSVRRSHAALLALSGHHAR
ncbi:MAG TPA: methyltransferase domain-containing protein [Acidobacteriota bacterium]|nr:methyltransferase domain-containing protein [Acidobacteriota bacterium]